MATKPWDDKDYEDLERQMNRDGMFKLQYYNDCWDDKDPVNDENFKMITAMIWMCYDRNLTAKDKIEIWANCFSEVEGKRIPKGLRISAFQLLKKLQETDEREEEKRQLIGIRRRLRATSAAL